MFLKLLFVCLFLNSISSSSSNLIDVLSNDVHEHIANVNSNIWVVLVAGSNGYFNYRHQADTLHAYHLVANVHKIPRERIILFMYDDIAWDDSNPYKGNIINYPNGENLYTDDLVKDYTRDEVTPENFIGALTKDPQLIAKDKKVLNSTSEDRVFIYFTDHGAPGMLSFPNAILSAKRFNKAINVMQEMNSFSKMLIYIEACESGSMFIDKLNPQKNIYALTASSYNEPSYAIYWDSERKTYLADEFSINWIMDSYEIDSENQEETIFKQYTNVKKRTKDSHVCEFGDLEMAKQYDTAAFQGRTDNDTINVINIRKLISDTPRQPIRNDEVEYYLTKIHSDLNKDDSFDRLIKGRRLMNQFISSLRAKFANKISVDKSRLIGRNEITNIDCYDDLLNHFNENCISLHTHTYLFRHLYLFVNTCNEIKKQNGGIKTDDLNEVITEHCSPLKNTFIRMSKVI